MRLITARISGETRAGRIEGDEAVLLPYGDAAEAIGSSESWMSDLAKLDGERHPLDSLSLAPAVPRPEKIICIGLNYPAHAKEANLAVPEYPPLFAKFWRSLVGPTDDIILPDNSDAVDWEAELCVVVGKFAHRVDEAEARDAVAGYTIMNDVSMRDWQLRTTEFLQGKTFERSSPLGPAVVTPDELGDPAALRVTCELDGQLVQDASTSEMVVGPTEAISYISQFITLAPGDVIATGTPSGVGGARKPPMYMTDGQTLSTSIEGLGTLSNRCVQWQEAVA